MKILLHICCGPCALYPLKKLRLAGHEVTGFFFNHNIHPYQEYSRRLASALEMAKKQELPIIVRDDYLLEEFLANVASNPGERCGYCYSSRLDAVAGVAASKGFDSFTSSLMYSRYQKHEQIVASARAMAVRYGVSFHEEDFRQGWQEGIRLSKEMGLYRQQYCGCIYSEKERYLDVKSQPVQGLCAGSAVR